MSGRSFCVRVCVREQACWFIKTEAQLYNRLLCANRSGEECSQTRRREGRGGFPMMMMMIMTVVCLLLGKCGIMIFGRH